MQAISCIRCTLLSPGLVTLLDSEVTVQLDMVIGQPLLLGIETTFLETRHEQAQTCCISQGVSGTVCYRESETIEIRKVSQGASPVNEKSDGDLTP